MKKMKLNWAELAAGIRWAGLLLGLGGWGLGIRPHPFRFYTLLKQKGLSGAYRGQDCC